MLQAIIASLDLPFDASTVSSSVSCDHVSDTEIDIHFLGAMCRVTANRVPTSFSEVSGRGANRFSKLNIKHYHY